MMSVLETSTRSPDLGENDDIYGFLIGVWDADVSGRRADGVWGHTRGEWHFTRVLEGRAIQDVWIIPPIADRGKLRAGETNCYGTTLRYFDAKLGAWRVAWVNPVTGKHDELVRRREGANIVQEGTSADGRRIRWTFTDVTPTSFRWTGESEVDGTWQLEAEFRARRRA